MNREQMKTYGARGEERVQILKPETFLSTSTFGYRSSSGFELLLGCIFKTFIWISLILLAAKYPRDLALHLSDEEGEFK